MSVLEFDKMDKIEIQSFNNWVNDNNFLFKNKNFLTSLITINRDIEFEDSLIEFYIYNRFKLESRYSFEWPKWLLNIQGNNEKEWVWNLFVEFFKDKIESFTLLYKFLLLLRKYLDEDEKDFDIEYELALKYAEFIESLRNTGDINYNNWVIYINKNIHTELHGFKVEEKE